MDLNITYPLTKKVTKNIGQKQLLYSVIRNYLETEQFDLITIRNLCAQIGITTSSFYNTYKSFENFLCEFLIDDFYEFLVKNKSPSSVKGLSKIIFNYELIAKYAQNKGVKYIQFFQHQYCKTISLSDYRKFHNETVNSILIEHEIAYHEAICLNEINAKYDSKIIFSYLDYIVSSGLFNWCNSDGKVNLLELVDFFLTGFLRLELTDDYYTVLKKILKI